MNFSSGDQETICKATPILLVGLRIRRLNLWENGKKIKVLCDPLFRCWTNWGSVLICILLYLPTDIWSTFVLKTCDERDMSGSSVYAAICISIKYCYTIFFFYFYFFANDSFENAILFLLDLTRICTKWLVFFIFISTWQEIWWCWNP